MERYVSPLTLFAHITKLKASLAEGDKRWKKAFEDAADVCRVFEVDHKSLHQNMDDWDNIRKGLEEDVVVAWRKSHESLQRVMDSIYRVSDQMWEQARGFCPSSFFTSY